VKNCGEIAIEVGVTKRTLWCEEFLNLAKHHCAVGGKRDSKGQKTCVIHVSKGFAVNLIFLERSTELALFDGHEPLADIGDSPGERAACVGEG
jgi:hypothetical protein